MRDGLRSAFCLNTSLPVIYGQTLLLTPANIPEGSQKAHEVLKDQKELVQVLVEDKSASEKEYRQALKALEYAATAQHHQEP